MAGHVLGAATTTTSVTGTSAAASREAETSLPPSQLYSSPSMPSDNKELAQPVLISNSPDAMATELAQPNLPPLILA